MEHVLDVFSVLGDRIELNPFGAVQASPDATLGYPGFGGSKKYQIDLKIDMIA